MTAAQPSRRGRPGYDLDSLLSICVQQFNEHGYEATSISMLAEALGVSKSAIYHHVQSKEELLQMALERALGRLEEEIGDVEVAEVEPATKVQLLLRRSVYLLVAEQPYVTLLLRLRGNSEVERQALARRQAATRRMEALVAEAQEAGSLRHDLPAKVVTRLLLGMVNSMADWYSTDGPVDADTMARTVITIAMDGMRPAA